MSKVQKISIALPREMADLVKQAVDAGGYSSASEVVREALRDWEVKQQERQALIQKYRHMVQDGIDSGPGRFNSMDELIEEARRTHRPRRKSA